MWSYESISRISYLILRMINDLRKWLFCFFCAIVKQRKLELNQDIFCCCCCFLEMISIEINWIWLIFLFRPWMMYRQQQQRQQHKISSFRWFFWRGVHDQQLLGQILPSMFFEIKIDVRIFLSLQHFSYICEWTSTPYIINS